MRVLDLFSGIGGFSLGLERAGMTTAAFCEIDPYCRAVLAKHWPHVPCYDDVRTVSAGRLRDDGIAVDVICGGFPCQPFSPAVAVDAPHRRDRVWIIAEMAGMPSDHARRAPADADSARSQGRHEHGERARERATRPRGGEREWPPFDAGACGMDDGLPHRVQRLRALGNSVVPQVVEVIGRAIMTARPAGGEGA